MKYGETVNFALDKQIERLVEVLAASALLQVNNRDTEAFKKLREHAFPDKINFTEKQIRQKQLELELRGLSIKQIRQKQLELEL